MDEFLQKLNAADVRCLLIGGQAMRLMGMPRYSMDWDLFVPPRDEDNFAKLNALLQDDLDAPLVPLGPRGENFIQTYQTRWGVLQFHLGLPGLRNYEDAATRAVIRHNEHGIPVKCLAGFDLLAAKQAANRPQDQADIEFLLELQRLGKLK
jgi:hypothetical protein